MQVWQRGQLIDIDHVDLQDAGYQVNYRVNINEAGWPEIANLPGFGEVTARTVVDYRDQNGRFSELSELLNVDGVGEKTLQRIERFIVLEWPVDRFVEQ